MGHRQHWHRRGSPRTLHIPETQSPSLLGRGLQGPGRDRAAHRQGRGGPGKLHPPGRRQVQGHFQPDPQHAGLVLRHRPQAGGADETAGYAYAPGRVADGGDAGHRSVCGRCAVQDGHGALAAFKGGSQDRKHGQPRSSAGHPNGRRDPGAGRRLQPHDDEPEGVHPRPDRNHRGQGAHTKRAESGHRYPSQPASPSLPRIPQPLGVRHLRNDGSGEGSRRGSASANRTEYWQA